MLHEAISALHIKPQGTYVDATFGRGGHSALILQSLGPTGRLIAFDRDPQAVAVGKNIRDERFEIIHSPFSALVAQLRERGVTEIDGILIDLGVSSPQLDEASRGFSFRQDGPLDMRMDPTHGVPISSWIASASTNELKKVISEYGEERFAFQIADAITTRCAAASRGEASPLESTSALADLVAETLRRYRARKEPGKHPATRTFQALRIFINNEIEELSTVLEAAIKLLRESGRIAVISFHSIEDRLVKQCFRHYAGKSAPIVSRSVTSAQRAMIGSIQQTLSDGLSGQSIAPCLKLMTRIRPSNEEVARNPRARSATLRVAERVASRTRKSMNFRSDALEKGVR